MKTKVGHIGFPPYEIFALKIMNGKLHSVVYYQYHISLHVFKILLVWK